MRLPRPTPRAGFSLIEVLAVIVILSILMVFLVPKLAGLGEGAKVQLTRARLTNYSVALEEYEQHFGRYPSSRFDTEWGAPPNGINLGVEALVLQLWSDDWGGTSLASEELINVDGDSSRKELTEALGRELFELADEWGNPVAYFSSKDYGRKDPYVTYHPDTGEEIESVAVALKDPRTKKWARAKKFQLLSAGSDGEFGTEDDLANFKIQE